MSDEKRREYRMMSVPSRRLEMRREVKTSSYGMVDPDVFVDPSRPGAIVHQDVIYGSDEYWRNLTSGLNLEGE